MDSIRASSDWTPKESWQRELYRMLDWNDVKLLKSKEFEFGAHTVSHCNLATASAEEARSELLASKEEIERRLDAECFSVAYPFGDAEAFSDSVVQTVRQLGFRLAFTLCLKRNPVRPDPLRLDRICVTGDLSLPSFRSLIAGWRNS